MFQRILILIALTSSAGSCDTRMILNRSAFVPRPIDALERARAQIGFENVRAKSLTHAIRTTRGHLHLLENAAALG